VKVVLVPYLTFTVFIVQSIIVIGLFKQMWYHKIVKVRI